MTGKRKNILWLSHLLPYPPKGGVLQRSFNLLKEVAKQHDVFMVAFNQKNLLESSFVGETDPLQIAKEALSEYCKQIEVVDVPSQNMRFGKEAIALKSLLSTNAYTVEWLNSDVYRQAVKRTRREHNIDAVLYDTISLSLYHDELSDLPSIMNHHNVESDMMALRAKKEKNFFKKLYFGQEARKIQKFEREVCPRHEVNIVCSEDDGEVLSSICGPLTIETVPNGADVEYFRPTGRPIDHGSLVFAGGLSWYPNLDAMRWFKSEIWPLIHKAMPDTRMNLIGKRPPSELTNSSDSGFRALGFVDDVRPYLEESGCYVCPIRDGGGTKLKILDALAMQCAVVAHPFACHGIDVTDGKNILLASTPESFSDKVKTVLGNSELRRQLGENGRKLVEEKYSFQTIGQHLAGLLSRVAQ